jgi:hydrogenase expression/formation protein HypD
VKYIDEYRVPRAAEQYVREIRRITRRSWSIMEICGGQTHAIIKYGIDRLLPKQLRLLHGPGCPVCITAAEHIDQAIELALLPNVIFCSFGDMVRVPGTSSTLLVARAAGADVRVVYSPLESVAIAQQNPRHEVVLFGIGFETTAPAIAMAVQQAQMLNLKNFSLLSVLALVPPAITTLLDDPANTIDGFLAAGHVCTVMGYREYQPIADKYGVPIVVTGFEPLDILQGIHMTVAQLERGAATVENQYSRAVTAEGNLPAQKLIRDVFQTVDRNWRGIGSINQSGLALRPSFGDFDALHRFTLGRSHSQPELRCISGLILQGRNKPHECAVFGAECTPEHPLGATMVSGEGACAAYFRYRQQKIEPGGSIKDITK